MLWLPFVTMRMEVVEIFRRIPISRQYGGDPFDLEKLAPIAQGPQVRILV